MINMTAYITLDWLGDIAFEANVDGHKFNLDLSKEKGGKDLGPRPKPLLLAALSGCSAMDSVSILKKMRIEDYKLQVKMEAEVADDHPMIYRTIGMNFHFTGDNLPVDNVIKSVEMSITKYCAVYAMLSKASTITTKVYINEQEVWYA